MRWKAFGSADMLNDVPEALLSIEDCSKVLLHTCGLMDPPEWFSACMFDKDTREQFLAVHTTTGGGYRPSEDVGFPALRGRAEIPKINNLKPLGDSSSSMPLGNWPGLAGVEEFKRPVSSTAVVTQANGPAKPAPGCIIEVGAWVELVGLSSKTGKTGIIVK